MNHLRPVLPDRKVQVRGRPDVFSWTKISNISGGITVIVIGLTKKGQSQDNLESDLDTVMSYKQWSFDSL